jgi:hypothetical protein
MTRANQWLAFSGVLSVGAGFLGGMMFSSRSSGSSWTAAAGAAGTLLN